MAMIFSTEIIGVSVILNNKEVQGYKYEPSSKSKVVPKYVKYNHNAYYKIDPKSKTISTDTYKKVGDTFVVDTGCVHTSATVSCGTAGVRSNG